ncbi:MAG: hypothetical protein K9L30_08090 [Desulfobacterales bacterium]|nr:hypothetical protein [Desulfobacterales bacterium]
MIALRQYKSGILFTGLFLIILLLASGCATSQLTGDGPDRDSSVEKTDGNAPLYYDFGDVLLPKELKLNQDSSFVYRTPGFTAGVLALKGRVEYNSLINFFEVNMIKDNWRAISYFKSPRTIMMYQKDNRWCVISIHEGDFTTHVEIWVAPTLSEVEGLLK